MSDTAVQHPNLIGGDWRESSNGRWIEVRNPADQREIVAEVPAMTAADVDTVYSAAVLGAREWRATSPVERGRALLETARLLRERVTDIASTLTREMGKTLAEATGEVGKAADFFEYYGGLGRAGQGEILAEERPGARAWSAREPVGVVLAVTPWNDPLLTPARKLAPALIAGNAVVLKPATYTPIVSLHLARALTDAGIPAGVVNTVTGPARDISHALIQHPSLSAVSFTGSNEVGERLRHDLASTNVKLLAELGGKNAAVVLADADLEHAAATIAAASFAQAGQRCTATSRVIAQHDVLDALAELLVKKAESFVLGSGLDSTTTMGPLVAPEHQEVVAGFVTRAAAESITVLTGGALGGAEDLGYGCFYPATVLTNVPRNSEIWREEIFGPVIALLAVDNLEQAIDTVNESPYGLAASIFTERLGAANRFADEVDVGQVGINLPTSGWDVHLPFGGFKASGSGAKEQGLEGLAFYTRTKSVAMASADSSAAP